MGIHTIESIYAYLRDGKTKIMGIVNVTPDSLVGDGLLLRENVCESALQQVQKFVEQGVHMIDIGGESTRPEAEPVLLEDELARVIPVVKTVRTQFPDLLISIDTMKPEVARQALHGGGNILNDVSGVSDSGMVDVAVEYGVPLILMHSKQSRRERKVFLPIAEAVAADMKELVEEARHRGLRDQQIILDPGIGFGKTVSENLALIHGVDKLKALGYPVLLGVSRKSFIGYTTGDTVDNRLPGSIAAATIGVFQGASIVRVHDVSETLQAIHIVDAVKKNSI